MKYGFEKKFDELAKDIGEIIETLGKNELIDLFEMKKPISNMKRFYSKE